MPLEKNEAQRAKKNASERARIAAVAPEKKKAIQAHNNSW